MTILLWLIIIATVLFTMVAVWTPIYNKLRVKIVICTAWLFWFLYMLFYVQMSDQKDAFIEQYDYNYSNIISCYDENSTVYYNYTCYINFVSNIDRELTRYRNQ